MAQLDRALRARINEAKKIAPRLRRVGLYEAFEDLYTEHIPKAEDVLAKEQHVAYAVTLIAMRDRIEQAKRAVAAVQGN
jgi:hypothetical protein